MMMKRKIQKGSDDKDEKNEEGFGDNLKQAQYKRSPM